MSNESLVYVRLINGVLFDFSPPVEILHSSLAEKEQELEKLCSLETDKVDK